MGWANPWVVGSLLGGAALLIAFPFIETHVQDPMFNLNLFKNRNFAAGNIATFLSSLARGGVMIMLVVLLQGIWLPLHGIQLRGCTFLGRHLHDPNDHRRRINWSHQRLAIRQTWRTNTRNRRHGHNGASFLAFMILASQL